MDPARIQGETTRLLREHLNAGWCYYVDWDLDRKMGLVLRDSSREGLPSLAGAHDVSDAPEFLQLLGRGAVLKVTDYAAYEQLPAGTRQKFAALGFRSMMVAPLVKEGRLIAALLVGDTEIREWSATEALLLVEAAERTWTSIERGRAEAALRESEERLREFGEASQDILWMRDAATLQWTYLTPAFEPVFGLSREEALEGDNYRSWLDLIIPEDRERIQNEVAKVRNGEHASFEYRVRRPSDGSIRWLLNTDFPIRDASGRVVGIGGVGTDITERKRSEEHQKTLLAELQHRVRNILALLRSLIGRTSRSKDDLSDFVDHLQARIDAMARTQAILTRSAGAAVNLEDIVRDELLAVAAPDSKYRVRGPEVELASKAAELLTLAIHELATNSVKYGALGDTPGSLDVTWTCNQRDGKKFVELEWSERGLTLHRIPERRGFGSELITERVPYELQGRGEMAFSSNGLTATIAFPLVAKTSVLLTDRPRIAKVLV